jgi:hypothetical protein
MKDGVADKTFWGHFRWLVDILRVNPRWSRVRRIFSQLFVCSWLGCGKLCDPEWDMITGDHYMHCKRCDRPYRFAPDTVRARRSYPTRDAIVDSFSVSSGPAPKQPGRDVE